MSFQGEVSETGAFTWDDSKETVLWRSDDGEVDLSENLSYGMKHLVLLNVENLENGSSQFGFTLINSDNLLALSAPEEYKGQLAPMVLTYKVQLPIGTEIPTQETIGELRHFARKIRTAAPSAFWMVSRRNSTIHRLCING